MREALLRSSSFELLSGQAGVGRQAQRAGRIVLGCVVGLAALGLIMLYSYSSVRGLIVVRDAGPNYLLPKQLQWLFLAFCAGWAASVVPLEMLRRIAVPAFAAILVLLAVVHLFGHEVNGARRWIHVGGLSLQPSEILKLGVLLYLAERLARRDEESHFGSRTPLLALLAPVGLGTVIVLVQPDLGTSLFIVSEAVVLLALAGVRPTRVLPFAAVVAPLIVLYAYTRFRHVRIRLSGTSDQVQQALVAIGSGGFTGLGLGEGAQKLGFVAEIHTDFVFALVGEELGFLGCAGVVLAFMAIAWFGSRLAWFARAVGPFAYYLAAGAVFIIVFQAVINLAVVTNLAPTKGIPLPFVSKGGSNLLALSMAVGFLLNIARRTQEVAREEPWSA